MMDKVKIEQALFKFYYEAVSGRLSEHEVSWLRILNEVTCECDLVDKDNKIFIIEYLKDCTPLISVRNFQDFINRKIFKYFPMESMEKIVNVVQETVKNNAVITNLIGLGNINYTMVGYHTNMSFMYNILGGATHGEIDKLHNLFDSDNDDFIFAIDKNTPEFNSVLEILKEVINVAGLRVRNVLGSGEICFKGCEVVEYYSDPFYLQVGDHRTVCIENRCCINLTSGYFKEREYNMETSLVSLKYFDRDGKLSDYYLNIIAMNLLIYDSRDPVDLELAKNLPMLAL